MRKTIADRKAELIDALVEARHSLIHAAQELPEEKRDKAFLGTWCIKDLLAHLIGWDVTNLQAVQEILSGQAPGFFLYYDKDWQSYNAGLVQKYRMEPFAALLAAAEVSHQQLVTFLEALPPNDLVNGKARSEKGRTITIRNLLQSESKDELEHAGQVREYFKPPE